MGLAAFCALRFRLNNLFYSYVLLNASIVLMSAIGSAEFVKYAAAEACPDDERRGAMVSRVITAGATLSMFGPFTSVLASKIDTNCELDGYANFFLVMGAFSLIGACAAYALKLPKFTTGGQRTDLPVWKIVARTDVWTAIFVQVSVQFAMICPMSATPLTMSIELDMNEQEFIISGCIVAHVLSMFLPGLATGSIMNVVGKIPVLGTGIALQAGAMVVTMAQFTVANFYVGLILLGAGWNFAFVSSTMLLINSHTLQERTKVTSFNETLRFAANGVAVILSTSLSWNTISLMCITFLGAVFVFTFFTLCRQRQGTVNLES